MKIGSRYDIKAINAGDWAKVGVIAGRGPNQRMRAHAMAERLSQLITQMSAQLKAEGLTHPIIKKLEEVLQQHLKSI